VPDPSYKIEPSDGPFQWHVRLGQLEKLAEQFWPGKEDEAKALRAYNVWCQFERECPWDSFTEFEPEHEPIPSDAEAIVELCTNGLLPALGGFGEGLGDNVRAELRRQGTSLEELCLSLKPARELIPWIELPRAEYRRDSLESAEIKRQIRRDYPTRP